MPGSPLPQLLSILVVALACLGPRAQAPRAGGGDDPLVDKYFGAIGEPGSFYVRFYKQGGCIREVRLLDHYVSPEAKRKADKTLEDHYAIVDMVERGIASLVLAEGAKDDPRFEDVQIDLDRYTPHDLGEGGIRFTLDCGNGLQLEKTYRHEPGWRDLLVEITLRATGDPGAEVGRRYPLILTGPTLPNPTQEHVLGQNPAVAIGAAGPLGSTDRETAVARPGTPGTARLIGRAGPAVIMFAGTTNRFFGGFLYGADDESARMLEVVQFRNWPARAPYLPHHEPYSVPQARYRFKLEVPAKGGRSSLRLRLYLGPKSSQVFGERAEYERLDVVMQHDLEPMCFCSVPGVKEMAAVLLWGMRNLHAVVGNWGVAIMLLTIVVRSLLVPLNFRMQKSMRAYGAKAQRLAPELEAIKKKYAKDPKRLQQEMLAFQRKHKMFPPLGGCLPLLITIPVFLGLFTALRVAYELRYQPFVAWIDDLSSPDAVFPLGLDLGILALPYFNLLPIIMMALWFVLNLGTPLPTDPQQRQVMKIMRWMPIVFGVLLYNYASGLMVYMITSSMFGIAEQRITRKILGPVQPTASGVGTMPTF